MVKPVFYKSPILRMQHRAYISHNTCSYEVVVQIANIYCIAFRISLNEFKCHSTSRQVGIESASFVKMMIDDYGVWIIFNDFMVVKDDDVYALRLQLHTTIFIIARRVWGKKQSDTTVDYLLNNIFLAVLNKSMPFANVHKCLNIQLGPYAHKKVM